MRKIKSDFHYETVEGVLVIYDKNKGNMSLTNDMENVLDSIKEREGQLPERIIYRDSDNVWDAVRYNDGNVEFISLRQHAVYPAIAALIIWEAEQKCGK